MKLALHSLFRDHAVLQRGKPLKIFGMAHALDQVKVQLGEACGFSIADEQGKWTVTLPAMEAGGPFALRVTGQRGEGLLLQNILLGDVFVCSGQSNMEWPLSGALNPEQEIPAANYNMIRLFQVPRYAAAEPFDQMQSTWQVCTPQSAAGFSAVAYFFGRALHQTQQIPIGLINASWGGTLCEAWTSEQSLASLAGFEPILDRLADARQGITADIQQRYLEQLHHWEEKYTHKDPGNRGQGWGWAKTDCNTSDWETMTLPTAWERVGLNIDGAVWFRREVTIPAEWAGADLTLSLGVVDDYDDTYVNGFKVGRTDAATVDAWRIARSYVVPSNVIRVGQNNVAVRVFDRINDGGIMGPAAKMFLAPLKDNSETTPLSLSGDWLYKIELRLEPRVAEPAPAPPITTDNQNCPGSLYNGMIQPLIQFPICAVIWYQGESNRTRAEQYRKLFPLMIHNWRQAWNDDRLPFLYVELPRWNLQSPDPTESEIAELREAQSFALKLPNVGRATIIDTGDPYDIHPPDKQTVGARLALVARALIYGENIEFAGPTYSSIAPSDQCIRVTFTHCTGGLMSRDHQPLSGFTIAGQDRKFFWADARADAGIDGNTVHLSHRSVRRPIAVRYGWADNPNCNLVNGAGIPASPFRTDDWPGITDGKG